MAAIMRRRSEPAKTTTVNKAVNVRAVVDILLPLKYLVTSYHSPSLSFRSSQTAYKVRALIV